MKPISERSQSVSTPKPDFQTKLKYRVKGNSKIQDLNSSVDSSLLQATNKSLGFPLRNSRHDHGECLQNEDVFQRTAMKLTQSNFNHHQHESCVCDNCLCGRHLCKLNVIKPDLTKNTIYRKSFYHQNAIPNIVPRSHEYAKLDGPHLEMYSTYAGGFNGKAGDKIQRPHPQDLLHNHGPVAQLTSYSSAFPGHKMANQYVKPTDKHTRAHFPLRSKSTYTNQYVKKQFKKDDYTYIPDQLKTGTNWFGKSSYGTSFEQPNPEYLAKSVKIVEKREFNPDFNHQYETIYKNDFIKKQTTICPSKIELETKSRGFFNETKSNFNENADYKAMSPEFHAIATSKHSFV